jgi:hypothetical protein
MPRKMPSEVVYGAITAIKVKTCHYVTEWMWRGLKRTAVYSVDTVLIAEKSMFLVLFL